MGRINLQGVDLWQRELEWTYRPARALGIPRHKAFGMTLKEWVKDVLFAHGW